MPTALRLLLGLPICAVGVFLFAYPRYLVETVYLEWSEVGLLAAVKLAGGVIFAFGVKVIGHIRWPIWVNWIAIGLAGITVVLCYVSMARLDDDEPQVERKLTTRYLGTWISAALFTVFLIATLTDWA